MKKYLSLVSLLFAFAIYAQTAKQIIDKNIEVTGGLSNWRQLNSIVLQGKVVLGVNDEYATKIYQQRPNLSKTVLVSGNKESVIEGFDGKNGYAMNYATNRLEAQKGYVPESFDTDYLDFEKKGFTVQLLGKEKVEDRDCFKVELKNGQQKTLFFFDAQNYLLLKEVKKEETLLYSDYRKTNSFLMPYRIESFSPKKDGDYTMVIYKIETNRSLPANTFKF